ncbi:small kinetochore-associated protein [Carassius auratus]|uniref:Small kinetochore-associated protein-like n=1 Tax=Carassius auratus TaxID=7957 RepID=A0A6P6JKV8_CARAU|nr:small kinetochore-associated protein-like [Carassius auratus]XP_026060052.1 small kinetochore-associated protein-like [Carassius auratus]XP_052402209.1 small kinetochore-associated protein [Carassius gibelio]XP_052402210.1 small kinetochore-associated protein [Carassius gibelio]XP_052402211.1 small kinetochore-associated protein [Carassius gibelio]
MKRVQIKDTAIPAQPSMTSRAAQVKNDTENKKNQYRSLKVPSTRYGPQNDIREQNRVLTSTNEDLLRQLEEMKGTVTDLEQRYTDLQGENQDIQKQLRDCHVLLVAESLDPVSGERLGQTAQQKEEQRKEVMTVSKNLLNELKLFGETAQEHAANLLEVENIMRDLTEAHEKLQQERALFTLDVEEMERELGEAERLLME